MGVPKFYRWISERYPCLSEVIKEYQIPEFDNLYLDMNGIIHVCSHPNDDDPHFRISEENIFADIFHYIEVLFRMIKPRKVFFMAVDGVAPRAKMNQQRGRRFRSAREAKTMEEEAIRKGETLPSEARFDSNCITPGTEFMVRLQEQLKFFVMSKISTDKLWQDLRIYLSGHETPGEGEHKVMDFIRYEKSCNPDYDPNTRHCLYGLDADLMMLGLCSHEPHFSLLREEVKFGGKKSQKRISSIEQTTFHLLHLSLMREYLELEFQDLKDGLKFQYNIENIIDDWVLMGFLVGNDFIPHLPNLHIAHDALPTLYKTYIEVLPKLDGYINEGGFLNLSRFEEFMKCLAQVDYEKFDESYADLKWLEGKSFKRDASDKQRSQKLRKSDNPFACLDTLGTDMDSMTLDDSSEEQNLIELPTASFKDELTILSDSDSNDDEETFELEFQSMKRNYYMNKLEYEEITHQVLEDQAVGYVRAIQWNLHYYYNGVVSWSWYYPHHYAPYISDIKNFSHKKLEYDYSAPFLPYEQLLAVLPSLSKDLLPKAYQNLMCSPDSPLIEFYPETFKTDLNGKQQDWEAVVLIPFLDENKLITAMKTYEPNLTEREMLRNKHGPCLLYTFSPNSNGSVISSLPDYFPDIAFNHAILTEIDKEFFRLPSSSIKKHLCDNILLDVYFPGFPTLKHISFTAQTKKASVTVFQMASRKESVIMKIEDNDKREAQEIADEILGKIVHVAWPHLVEARVTALWTSEQKYCLRDENSPENDQWEVEEFSKSEQRLFNTSANNIESKHLTRHGIDIKNTRMLVHAQPITGRQYIFSTSGRVTLEKKWADTTQVYPYQTIVKDISVHNPAIKSYYSIEEIFPAKSTVFMLGHPHYGFRGEVINIDKGVKCKIRVKVFYPEEPDFDNIFRQQKKLSDRYFPGFIVAQKLHKSSHLISRITGSMFIIPSYRQNHVEGNSGNRVNIGLNLKFNKKNEEMPGFTKRSDGTWLYSNQAINLIDEYLNKFPDLWRRVVEKMNSDVFFLDDVFPEEDGQERLSQVQKFLKELPCANVERRSCDSDVLDNGIVKAIEETVDALNNKSSKTPTCANVLVRPKFVYKPSSEAVMHSPDDNAEFKLFDRVVNIRSGYSVPLGLRGTVIGIHKGELAQDTSYDVLFDEKFVGGLSIQGSSAKVHRMSAAGLINLTHGNRKNDQNHGSTSDGSHSYQPSNYSSASFARNAKNYAQVCAEETRKFEYSSPKSDQYVRINHSPTSPFQPQNSAYSSTPNAAWKPRNSAPTKPSNHFLQDQTSTPKAQPVAKHQSDQKPAQEEFLRIWQSLKETNLSSTPESKSQGNTNSNISLEHAAKSLPKLTPKSMSPEKKANDPYSTSENTPIKATEENNSRESNTPDVESYNNEGSVMLKQLLHINDSKDCNKSYTLSTISDNIKKEETSRLSVDQLFNDVKKAEMEAAEKRKSLKKVEAAEAQMQKHLSMNKPHEQPNCVLQLLSYLQSNFEKIPLYTYLEAENMVTAEVTLPDGKKFIGLAENRQKASESAAAEALRYLVNLQMQNLQMKKNPPVQNVMKYSGVQLKPQFAPQHGQGFQMYQPPMAPRPAFQHQHHASMSPDMGFSQNYLRARLTSPVRFNIPNPAMDLCRMNYEQQMRTAHSYHSSHLGNNLNSPVKPMGSPPKPYSFVEDPRKVHTRDVRSPLSPSATPFIPLQVTKQQTSKKNSTPQLGEEIKDSETEETSKQTIGESSTSETPPPKSKQASAAPMKKSRLACNFTNPVQEDI